MPYCLSKIILLFDLSAPYLAGFEPSDLSRVACLTIVLLWIFFLNDLQTFKSERQRYKEVYDNLLEIILEIDALTKIYNVTKLGFLFDTAMSSRHGVSENLATGNMVKKIFLPDEAME